MMRVKNESDSGRFIPTQQDVNASQIPKTRRSVVITDDLPESAVQVHERRSELRSQQERASRLETENAILRARIEELERLAFVDSLTGLPNRLALEEHIRLAFDHARETGETLAFAIADIDLFKLVNDRFGHATGDAVLREVGLILRSHCRITDLAARLGGEEFAIIMPGLTRREAFNACQRLRLAVEEFDWSAITQGLKITLSIGLTDSVCESPAETLALADRQMYRAKLEGRNRVRATRSTP
jgi:diguanylate cyclase (GGDEF)-like protein